MSFEFFYFIPKRLCNGKATAFQWKGNGFAMESQRHCNGKANAFHSMRFWQDAMGSCDANFEYGAVHFQYPFCVTI